MQLTTLVLALHLSSIAMALVPEKRSTVNGRCTITPGNLQGVCITTSSCSSGGGVSLRGFCPGTPDNVRCCFKADCSGASSACLWTSTGCSGGEFLTGKCPGPSNFKCCRKN